MEENFILVFEFIQQEIFKPLINSLGGVEWVESFINFLSKLLTSLFKYEINITVENLAALLTTIILIIAFCLVIKTFIFAFKAFFEVGETKKRRRK